MTTQDEIKELHIEMRNSESEFICGFITLAMALVPATVFLGISLISLALK